MDTGDLQRRTTTKNLVTSFTRALPVLPLVGVRVERAQELDRIVQDTESLALADATVAMHLLRLSVRHLPAYSEDQLSVGFLLARTGAATLTHALDASAPIHATPAARRLYVHSVHVALMTRMLMQRLPQLRVSPSSAYLAGLLHDIGRFIMLAVDADDFERVEASEVASGEDLRKAERRTLGFDHAELGGYAARAWGFPEPIVLVNTHHHLTSKAIASLDDERTRGLVGAVQLADRLAFVLSVHPELVEGDPRSQELALDEQGVTECLRHFQLGTKDATAMLASVAARAERIVAPLFDATFKLDRRAG